MAGIYIHIPFCKKKCIYCDFYSIAAKPGVVDDYIKAVCNEAAIRQDELSGNSITTLYIGGGTPSMLSITQMSSLVNSIRSILDLSKVEEFTIEVNPDDISAEFVDALVDLGINRVSMGVQSFVDAELKFLNRRHDASRAIMACETIHNRGIDNISLDLIYGIPGQDMRSWQYSLDRLVKLAPKHVSCYNLSYEEGTPLYRMLETDKVQELSDARCVEMYEMMCDALARARYEHYEISNFAQPGWYSRHNSNYWNKTAYLGLGASAHSFTQGVRSYNPRSIKNYIALISENRKAVVAEEETVSERYNEEVMLRLRTNKGIDAEILHQYGDTYYNYFIKEIRQFVNSGLVVKDGNTYRLSRNGVMLSDMVMRELMYV